DARSAFERAEDRPVYLLGFRQGEITLSTNINPNYRVDVLEGCGLGREQIVSYIRNAEMDCLLDRSRALLTSADKTVFKAPSGKFVRHFIRVGNLQYDREAIDAISFWLLPHMRHAAAILTDTWSISSIALNTARIAASHFGSPACPVELLPDYLQTSDEAKDRAGKIVARLVREATVGETRHEVLCLVSATQSGSLQQRLDEVARAPLGKLRPRYVAIFALGSTGMASLRDLASDPRFALLPPDSPGAASDRPVPIDPKVYFPLEFQDLEYELKKGEAEASKDIMDALARTGLLQVHRDISQLGRTRHHAIHLHAEGLLGIPRFRDCLNVAAQRVETSPIAIVTPPAPGCRAIAGCVADILRGRGVEAPVHEHPNLFFKDGDLTAQDEELRSRIRSADGEDSIVIVVDSWIDDSSLSQYQRFLRSEGYRGRIHYIAGVARPPDEASWNRSANRLRYRDGAPPHSVTSGFLLPLPDWTEKACPWCAESRLYDRWSTRQPLPQLLADRRDHLMEARTAGLSDTFALSIPALAPMALGEGSFYVRQESSQVDAFVAVSSALQRLRSGFDPDRPPLGPRHFPTATVLKSRDYLLETWTDSVLRAVFLRAATIEELTYTGRPKEAERATQLHNLLVDPSPGMHDVALEILLAAALGKAPLEIGDDLRRDLARLGLPQVVDYMLDMIQQDREQLPGSPTSPEPVSKEKA
ncbi:MAG TPA: hypothetical protein VFR28_00035, partial [Allosphingosinicella sp.]|nr:hypothetical protein [Allosphingosinicella sp.]